MKNILKALNENMVVEELIDQSKIIRAEEPPYPQNIVCPQSALDWHVYKTFFKNELNLIATKHNQDNEKRKETVKVVVDVPVVVSFSNNEDEDVWVVKMETNLKRMMELFNQRHKK